LKCRQNENEILEESSVDDTQYTDFTPSYIPPNDTPMDSLRGINNKNWTIKNIENRIKYK